MKKLKDRKYEVIMIILNVLASSKIQESNVYPNPLEIIFNKEMFLLTLIFILSVSYLTRRLEYLLKEK